jgi:hypothetical protein
VNTGDVHDGVLVARRWASRWVALSGLARFHSSTPEQTQQLARGLKPTSAMVVKRECEMVQTLVAGLIVPSACLRMRSRRVSVEDANRMLLGGYEGQNA